MPYSLATRLPSKDTSVVLLGGETFTAANRRDEFLRRISEQTKRLRGRCPASTMFSASVDAATRGRNDSLEQILKRGIIPIHVIDQPATTLHAWVEAYPNRRSGPDVVTVASSFATGTYSKTFSMVTPAAGTVGPNADDATLTGLTGVPIAVDFTATDSLDPQSNPPGATPPTPPTTGAMGAARARIT